MEFNDVIKNRYSCRSYANKPVEKEKILAVLEAGRLAPTAKNLQEQHIYVITDEKGFDKIDSVTPCRFKAPVVLAVAFDKNNVYTYPGTDRTSGVEDAAIVATHLVLAAENEGLASCWVNNFNPNRLHELLNLPENEEILMLMPLGYASDSAVCGPNHEKRKPLEETVTWL